MNPYEVLGISTDATAEEIKKAYRREAMKWHPDRSDDSSEAKERFHQAAEDYKILSENVIRGGNGQSASGSKQNYREGYAGPKQSDNYSNYKTRHDETGDEFADSIFWNVMLDYAIKLAQTGIDEHDIAIRITQKGCPQRIAAVIADKAFNIHAHYVSGSGKKSKPRADASSFKDERLENELHRAFLGEQNYIWSSRGTIDYYLVVFREFRQLVGYKRYFRMSLNKRLVRVLNFAILFFAVTLVAIQNFPGPSEYKLLPDVTLLQLPFAVAALMFVWTVYRKLWVFTLVFGLIWLLTLAFYNAYMPQALNSDMTSLLQVAAVCFAPFVLMVLLANHFYYRKAQGLIRSANQLFDDQLDKIIWIKNRAGTSGTAAFLCLLGLLVSVIYLAPRNAEFRDSFVINLPGFEITERDTPTRIVRRRLKEAGELFEIAESHFNDSPPDYMKAEMAYSTAADNGSLLAAYKLGYMYYTGEGVIPNDVLAFDYFRQATKSPLAFQPHSLQLTTLYLSEAYNNLGIMYQNGIGHKTNLKKAKDMYKKAVDFGSVNAKRNLRTVYTSGISNNRKVLVKPDYE